MAISVTTQHNDNFRTGANLEESSLRVGNVNLNGFGRLFDFPVDGHIYGQPLYLSGVNIPSLGVRNVIYVATMHNSVYAFDADNTPGPQPLWHKTLEPSVALPNDEIGGGESFHDIQVEIGIISTPVISTVHNAIYVVSFTGGGNNFQHHLHALDLSTGTDILGGPRVIAASVPGTGAGSKEGMIRFQSHLQNQRPALLLSSGKVYVAFASYGDHGEYHGWVLAYEAATLAPTGNALNLTPNGLGAGIWQAGQGPAADDQGHVYVLSGNGDFNERTLFDKVILAETALGGPAVANMNDAQMALAWTGNEALRRLNVAISVDGRQFTDKVTLGETSLDTPALAFGNGRLFLAWTGPDAEQHLNVSSSTDHTTFGNKVTLNESSGFGPGLTFGGGRLFLAWVGMEATQRVNVMSSADGVHWENKVTLNEHAVSSPSLSFINGKLYLLWVGTEANSGLNVLESLDGLSFSNKKTFPNSSEFHPTMSHDGEFQLLWAGRDRGYALRLVSGTSPTTLGNLQTYLDTAGAAPALTVFRGNLYALWTGNEALRRLNVAAVSRTPSLGDCFVKASQNLEIQDWFTPFNTLELNDTDSDLGSGGILLLPGTQLLTGGGKEGKLYLLRRDHLGRFCSSCNATTGETQIVQSLQATAGRNDATAPQPAPEAGGFHHIHGSPVYWNSPNRGPVVYVWGEADRGRAFAFNGATLSSHAVDMTRPDVITPARSMPGAMLSLSADGSQSGSGILWASHPTKQDANQGVVSGTLRALDASDLTHELWNSDQAVGGRDQLGKLAKFSPPTIANGRVYIATFSKNVVVYGLLG